tara:strand:+ start:301 stop:759 length:459 start_codon:yes stop_codon:yes gene_type:complete
MSTKNNTINTWDFVEENYPNYHSSAEIAECLDLDKFLDEKTDGSLRFWTKEILLDEMKVKIYEKAIQAFLEKKETTASIVWSVNDFEVEAERQFFILKEDEDGDVEGLTSWEQYFDKSKFKMALDEMIEDHDAEYGINNYSVQNALETYCIF